MDFGVDEELNYEEDLPEEDSVNNDVQSKDCSGEDLNDNTKLSESNDQYLQIDYSEDENLASDETPQEAVTTKVDNVEKEVEKNEKSNQENVSSEQKDLSQPRNIDTIISNKSQRKKRVRPFHRRKEFNKKAGNALSFNPWLPEYNFIDGRAILTQKRRHMHNKQMLNLNQDFSKIDFSKIHQLQKSTLPPLITANSFLPPRMFVPNTPVGVGINNPGFPGQVALGLLGQSFSSDLSNYQIGNGKVLLPTSFGYQSIKPEFFFKGDIKNTAALEGSGSNGFYVPPSGKTDNEIIPNPGKQSKCFTVKAAQKQKKERNFEFFKGVFDQNQNFKSLINQQSFANNFQINDATKNGLIYGGISSTNANSVALPKMGVKNFGAKNEKFINVGYKTLEEEEKKALTMKKEARLKRFMQDGAVKKDKLADSGFEESFQNCSFLKVECLEEKKIRLNVQQNSPSESLLDKPEINKESLLKKINPFEEDVGKVNCTHTDRIKQERVYVKPWASVPNCFSKTETKSPPSTWDTLAPVKTEVEPHVKFVRTISKTFDELTSRKGKTGIPTEKKETQPPVKPFPFMGVDTVDTKGKSFPKQPEPQLTGCIVKVLNVPPTTTTNDILALCSPIGIVKEIKLNFPKENSVVIRFAEPTCAENFFSLYHGQKMNNYFLNVIVV